MTGRGRPVLRVGGKPINPPCLELSQTFIHTPKKVPSDTGEAAMDSYRMELELAIKKAIAVEHALNVRFEKLEVDKRKLEKDQIKVKLEIEKLIEDRNLHETRVSEFEKRKMELDLQHKALKAYINPMKAVTTKFLAALENECRDT